MNLRSFLRRPANVVAAAWMLVVLFGVIVGPWLTSIGPLDQNLMSSLSGPSSEHWLGTDTLGRDLLSRLLTGGRPTLTGAALAVLVFLVVGVPLGVVAGYYGRWADRTVSLFAELMFATPGIIIVLVVLAVFGNDLNVAMVTLGILGSGGLIRVLRGSTLAIKEELFVRAARTSGLTEFQILRRHVVPLLAGPIIVQAFLFAGAAIIVETGFGFLGFGTAPPKPSWGNLVTDASQTIYNHPWMLVPTGGTILLTVLSLGVLGDAVRDQRADRTRRGGGATAAQLRPPVSPPPATVAPSTASSADVLLSVRGLTVSVPTAAGLVDVVRGADFDVARGEIVGLVGESGCGKTVTSMAVLGLLRGELPVTAGEIRFDGIDLVSAPAAARRRLRGTRIAFVSQEPIASLDPAFTVGQQLREVVRRHHGGSRRDADARVLELLGLVQLDDPPAVARKYPHQLSGGMAQRIGIAAALAGDPDLLIADEPTTALDVTVQAEVLNLLLQLRQSRHLAVVLVTHDFGVLAKVCDRAVVMYAGEVVEVAPVGELLSDPRMPYSAALIESNPARAETGAYLPSIAGSVPAPHDWPQGCHFQARCALADERCAVAPVALVAVAEQRMARCLRVDEMARPEVAVAVRTPIPASVHESSAATDALLTIDGLSVVYTNGASQQLAVDDVSVSIQPGRTLGVVGGSGAGKSTLGAAVLGLAEPSAGRITFDGRDITHVDAATRRALTREIQVIFQDPYSSLNPARTIGQTLSEPLRLNLGLDAATSNARVTELLEEVGLPARAASQYPMQFSGGQRQRIAIARALAVEPRLIVCDEAVSALDLSVQAQVLNLLKRLQVERGLTYLFVTHDLEVVRHMADDIAVMKSGQVCEYGPADAVYHHPQHPYTRRLLAANPSAVLAAEPDPADADGWPMMSASARTPIREDHP